MGVICGLRNVTENARHGAVAVGVFDGVHWGHRAIFERLKEAAAEKGIGTVALTFDKHPAELLAPDKAPPYVSTLDQRIELIRAAGVEHTVVAEFDEALANLTHEEFAAQVLDDTLRARHIVVGGNFRFGRGRKGDVRYLSSIGPAMGMGVSVVSSVIIGGAPVSSTRVRSLVGRGEMEEAAKLLGRRFALRGTVVPGDQRGRTLGFPTANIQTAPRQLLPGRGVYAADVTIGGSTYNGLCNVGCRPTFGCRGETVEVHLIGFTGDLYGTTLDVVFVRKLRDEIAFESPEKLVEQIKRDLESVRRNCSQSMTTS